MSLMFTRRACLALWLFLGCMTPALAQLSITYSVPGTSIGLNLGGYPTLQRIPGYPVYYAPGVNTNYFFYDGLYWVFDGDRWYASSWYNGPWGVVDPYYVPDYVLRVPVRYYRYAPAYFKGWRADAPPRWDQHWGRSWVDRRHDWDRWDRRVVPAPAPLPTYQRNFRGDRYPGPSQQADLHVRNYRYQPHEAITREHFQERREQARTYRPQQDERIQRQQERRVQETQQAQRQREQRQEAQQQRDQRQEAQRQQRDQRQEAQRQQKEQRQEAQRQQRDQRQDAQRQQKDQRQEAQRQQRDQRQEAQRREAPKPESRGREKDNPIQGRPKDYSGG